MSRPAAAPSRTMLGRVLFLGRDNYYKSRFCEELFNHHASSQRVNWLAFSRALRESPATLNHGPMSPIAAEQLRRRGIRPVNHLRLPLEATNFDFLAADIMIAVEEDHDRSLLENRWASQVHAVRHWPTTSPGALSPTVILSQLEAKISLLLGELRDGHSGHTQPTPIRAAPAHTARESQVRRRSVV